MSVIESIIFMIGDVIWKEKKKEKTHWNDTI